MLGINISLLACLMCALFFYELLKNVSAPMGLLDEVGWMGELV